jgi:multicomponent Na+:H+ antiporter subunit A
MRTPMHPHHAAPSGRLPRQVLAALFPATLFAALCVALASRPLPWRFDWAWVPALGLEATLYVDGLAAQYLLLITGIGTLVFVYAAGYLGSDSRSGRTLALLGAFMLAMIGAAVSDHLLLLFTFWELTSVLSFLLVGFDHEREASRDAAKQALLVTGFGGLALLAGIVLLASAAGTYSLQGVIAAGPRLLEHPQLEAALGLVMIGAFTKSAQVPFHFWLPNAMAAPTPVSAYLHSATMVKLGIYLLARLDAAFSDLLFWENALAGVGTVTAVFAALQTLRERDLKRIFAWSTVATLGTLTLLVGLPGRGAALAVVTLFFAHALYKAPLFFVAGNLDHGAGTRIIDELTGMRRYMPWTAAAAMLAALSMAGMPLSYGFVAKDVVAIAKVEAGALAVIGYATVIVGGISVAVAAVAAIHVFWGRDTSPRDADPHEVPWTMRLPALVLVALGLLFGVQPTLVDPLLGVAATSISPGFDPATVRAAYDTGPVLRATALAAALGTAVYFAWDRLHALLHAARPLDRIGAESWYWRQLRALVHLAAWQTQAFQHGRLPRYLGTLVAGASAAVLGLLWLVVPATSLPPVGPLSWPVTGAAGLTAAGALAAPFLRDRLLLLLASGMVGYGSALVFLFTGAPDLAFTQFAVETVLVVVAAATLGRIGGTARATVTARGPRVGRFLVSAAFGASMAALVLFVAGTPLDPELARFFGEQSAVAANGRNVVNVILVDFRGLDTLGEIAVVAFALLAALPLMAAARHRRRESR